MFYNLWILLLGSARNIWSIKHNHRKIRLSEKTIIKKKQKRKKKSLRGICESVMYITHKFFGVCPYRLARSGHWIFIPRTGVRIPVGTPEGFRPLERAAFLFFRCAKRGDRIFDKCQKPEGRAKRCSIPRLSQRVLGRLKERPFCFSDVRNAEIEFLTSARNPKGERSDVQSRV